MFTRETWKKSERKKCRNLHRLRTVPETVSVCQYLFKGKVEESNIYGIPTGKEINKTLNLRSGCGL